MCGEARELKADLLYRLINNRRFLLIPGGNRGTKKALKNKDIAAIPQYTKCRGFSY